MKTNNTPTGEIMHVSDFIEKINQILPKGRRGCCLFRGEVTGPANFQKLRPIHRVSYNCLVALYCAVEPQSEGSDSDGVVCVFCFDTPPKPHKQSDSAPQMAFFLTNESKIIPPYMMTQITIPKNSKTVIREDLSTLFGFNKDLFKSLEDSN